MVAGDLHMAKCTTVSDIVERCGGLTALARELGHKHPTTVQNWSEKNRIPHWRWFELRPVLDRLGVKVSESDVERLSQKKVQA